MDLDSALLRAFVAVADKLHFSQAASALFVTQQALSKRIARLEGLVGVRLVDRDRHGVTLTPAGSAFLPHARAAVDAVDAALAPFTGAAAPMTIDVLDEHLAMLPRVRTIAKSVTEASLSVTMRGDSDSVLHGLRRGSVDFALGRPGAIDVPWPSDIRGAPVLAERIELLVPTGHELDRSGGVTMEELGAHPLWFPTVGAPREWTELLDELVEEFNLSLDPTGSTFGFDYWLDKVARGTAPPSFIGAAMALPDGLSITRLSIIAPSPVFWWWAMWRRRHSPALVDRIVGAVAVNGQTYPAEDSWVPERDRTFLRDRAP